MGTISYIIILFNNSEIFTKISINLIILLFLYTILISINMYLDIKKEEHTLLNINNILNIKTINENIETLKYDKTNSYKIYTSGIKEFIYLYKNGINDINAIVVSVKEAMKAELLNENLYTYINKIKIIKILLININLLYLILSFILSFQKESVIISQKLHILNIMSILNEMFLPTIISIIILVKIKIIENMFANLNFKIYNKQKVFIKNFLIILYHKFYE